MSAETTPTVPTWVNRTLFPFASKWMDIDGMRMHYIDEGQGPVVLFFHGTPEWSFGWRHLVQYLRSGFRCIATDYPGFGLSDKPSQADYSVKAQCHRMKLFIEKVGLTSFSIVANDFGGGIALGLAVSHPERVESIVLFNTWMRDLRHDPHYSRPARVMNSWFGKFLYKQLNFPVSAIMPAAYGNRQVLTPEIHKHYKMALPTPSERQATYFLSKELMNAGPWWEEIAERLIVLRDKPVLIFWGMKDKFVLPKELEFWKARFPQARTITFPDAGHFVQEEKPVEMAAAIKELLTWN